jgi:O-antigen ligase
MKHSLASWQAALSLLVFFFVGVLAVGSNELVGNGIIFVAAVYAFSTLTSETTKRHCVVSWVALVAVAGLVVLTGMDKSPEQGYFESLPFLFLMLTAYVLSSSEQAAAVRALKMVVLGAVPFALWAFYKGAGPHEYLHGNFDDSNIFGALMFSSLCPAVGFTVQALRDGKKSRVALWLVTSGVLAAAVYGAHSRGSWFAAVIAIAVSLVAVRKALDISGKRIIVLTAFAALLAVATTAAKFNSDLSQNNGLGASAHSRTAMLVSTFHMIKDHPITGSGWGTWSSMYPQYRLPEDTESSGMRAHNDYLEAWASGGVLGEAELLAIPLLLALAFCGIAARATNRPYEILGACAGATLLVAQAGANYIFHQAGVAILAGALLGVLHAKPGLSLPALANKQRILRNAAMSLVLVLSAGVGTLTYLASAPAFIIANPNSVDSRLFGKFMTETDLKVLAKAEPFSPIPYFAIAHQYTILGAVEQHNPEKQKAYFDKALQYYDLSEQRNPYDPVIPFRKALVYGIYPGMETSLRYFHTVDELKGALRLAPAFPSALEAYSQMLVRDGKYDDAIKQVEDAIQVTPIIQRPALQKLRLQLIIAREEANQAKKK